MDFLKQIPDFIDVSWACSEKEQRIVNLKREINDPRVHIYPNVKYEEMPNFYSSIDVLLNPGEFKYNMTRVTLEAMACGRPVIMFPGSRYPLIDQKNGYIIEPDINAVLHLLNDINQDRMRLLKIGEESRKIIEKEFSTEVVIPKIRKIYDRIRE